MFACFGVLVLFLYLAVQFVFAVGSNFSAFFFLFLGLRPDGMDIDQNERIAFPPVWDINLSHCGWCTAVFCVFINSNYVAF